MKNHTFFATSILSGFWEGFGRALASQNPRFSHFFRCFFDVIFQGRFGKRKNGPKMRKNQTFPLFGLGFAVVPRLLGKGKDRGKNTSGRIARTNCAKECRDWPAVIGQSQLEMSPARRWHTFGGRRIANPPGGDHRRPTPLGRSRPMSPGLSRLSIETGVVCLGKFSASSRQVIGIHGQKHVKISKKLAPDPPKSRPGAFKIEFGALQDAIFQDI